ISFSSDPKHALCNSTQLFEKLPGISQSGQAFMLQSNGWVLGPAQQLLFWVPPASRQSFYSAFCNPVPAAGNYVMLDLSHMAHGRQWYNCY
ncbi:hypothetical protein BJ138DRAFT_982739, partial [Hygrophoropsis aurantiaca]